MALSTANVGDIEQYKSLSTHLVGILDKEADIDSVNRQLTPANILKINTLYGAIIDRLEAIVAAQAALP